MAWMELHDTLPDHYKVIGASSALKMDKDAFVGKLVRLWLWALNHRESGFLRENEAETVAEIMRYRGKPATLIAALLEAGLIDREEGGYRIHGWEDSVGMLISKREEQRAMSRERKRKSRSKAQQKSCDEEQDNDMYQCDSHTVVTRDNGVTSRTCHADVTPSTKHKQNRYIDDDDDYRAGAQAGARTRTQAPAREEDLREDEKSVLEDERLDGRLDSAQSAVRAAYRDAFGREALPAEVESIVRAAVISGTVEVAGEAVRRAAQHGARSVVPYVKTLLDQWAREGAKTVDELTDYEFQTDIEEGRLPRWLRPGGGVKA